MVITSFSCHRSDKNQESVVQTTIARKIYNLPPIQPNLGVHFLFIDYNYLFDLYRERYALLAHIYIYYTHTYANACLVILVKFFKVKSIMQYLT